MHERPEPIPRWLCWLLLTPSGCSLCVGSCLPMNSSRTSWSLRLESERTNSIVDKCVSVGIERWKSATAAHSIITFLSSHLHGTTSGNLHAIQLLYMEIGNCWPRSGATFLPPALEFEWNGTLEYLFINLARLWNPFGCMHAPSPETRALLCWWW